VDGRYTISGQHNQMFHMSAPSERVQQLTGKYPLIWGGEWGFSDDRHDTDNVKYRPRLLDQIRERHKARRIAVLTWHQASPTVGEPCDFRGGVICKITDADWDGILTPGAPLHKVWEEHVDRLAAALATLRDERIPIIFRPYHEMNGNWFWWGGKPDRFKALWAMMYDRFTRTHRLDNLLWAWTCDRPRAGVEAWFPGADRVDLLGTDIYPGRDRQETYPQEWYDRMRGLAAGRPVALSEISELPAPDVLERQPYVYFMCWDNMVFAANKADQLKEVYSSPRVLSERPQG
jgi:mannan endo-1,4-beta-mannosidase